MFPISRLRYTSDLAVVDDEKLISDDAVGGGETRPTPESSRLRGGEAIGKEDIGRSDDRGAGVLAVCVGHTSSILTEPNPELYLCNPCEATCDAVLSSRLVGRVVLCKIERESLGQSCGRPC